MFTKRFFKRLLRKQSERPPCVKHVDRPSGTALQLICLKLARKGVMTYDGAP